MFLHVSCIVSVMKLPEYIALVGDDAAAKLFGVKSRTVSAWRRGERRPSRRLMTVIVSATDGRITAADLLDPDEEAAA